MANNRLYLRHTPSGETLRLGKRMGGGYYAPASAEQLGDFFARCEAGSHSASDLDAFVLDFEMGGETEQ